MMMEQKGPKPVWV